MIEAIGMTVFVLVVLHVAYKLGYWRGRIAEQRGEKDPPWWKTS